LDKLKVSVIVPVYNVEAYLRRCVDSVLAQTFTDIEIILVDDGSPDNCPAICDEYAGKDNRIKVIHQKNAGLSGARNAGLDAAKGDYFAFIDSDDYIAPEMIDKLLNALLREDADISICGFQRIDENAPSPGGGTFVPFCVLTGMEALEKLYTPDYQYFTIACNKLFKRSLFDTIRFPAGKLFEDGYAAFRYYYASSRVVCLPECFYHYFTRSNSITTAAPTVKNLDGIDADRDSLEFLKEKGCANLVAKAQTKYAGAIINNLRRFDLEQKDVRLKFKAVNRDFRLLYSAIMKNPGLSTKEKILITLFGISPRLCKLTIKVKKL
jgi:glycosyltransferase involved in cell wall biosynthesis